MQHILIYIHFYLKYMLQCAIYTLYTKEGLWRGAILSACYYV